MKKLLKKEPGTMTKESTEVCTSKRRKKIIIVTSSITSGGAQRVIVQLANYFSKQNYECQIIAIYKNVVFYDIDDGVKLTQIDLKTKKSVLDKVIRYTELRRIVKKEKPDVILTLPEEIGVYVILALLGLDIPVFVSERNNPWVMPYKKTTRILRTLMYPFAKGIIFQTEMAKSFFSKKIQKKGVVIQNPVHVSRIPYRYEGKREKKVVAAGRLQSQKNFSNLINAFDEFSKENDEYKLVIYGEGNLRAKLEKKISDLKLNEKVYLPGRNNNLFEEINSAAMFVLSSDYEGMPNVLIEAMAMGMPVISTDCPSGGPAELIKNGENGILVPVGDTPALTSAMCKIAGSKELAEKLGKNAVQIRKKLDINIVAEKWKKYLESFVICKNE